MNRTVFFVPLSLVGLFFTVYILLASTTNFLSVEPGYAIGEVSRWCERISGGYFREPANALSNLGFMFTGLLMFWIPAFFIDKKHQSNKSYFPWYWLGIAFYMTAFAIWLQGYPNQPFCNPDSLIQPHAIWHILSSCATLSFFFFFRTARS